MRFIFFLLLLEFSPLSAKIILVKPDGRDDGDGSSWDLAFNNIGVALLDASYGDSIWLKEGVYGKFMDSSYEMKSGVKIFGGFKGTETSLSERSEDFIHSRIEGHNQAFVCINTDSTTLIDGIYFTQNYASIILDEENDCNVYNGDYRCTGGAIFIGSWDSLQPACLQINNCIFDENYADNSAGAIFLYAVESKGGLWVRNTKFLKNKSLYNDGDAHGGAVGIYRGNPSQFGYLFENCLFESNQAWNDGALYSGGGNENNYIQFVNCTIKLNNSKFSAGAIAGAYLKFQNCNFEDNLGGDVRVYPGRGGAVKGINLLFENCIFIRNRAMLGGAVFGTDLKFRNTQFISNSAVFDGGAVFHSTFGNSDDMRYHSYVHCTFSENRADSIGGAISASSVSRDSLTNCLFYMNSAGKKGNNLHYWNSIKSLCYIQNTFFENKDTSDGIFHQFQNLDSMQIGQNNIFGCPDPKLGKTSEGLLRPGDCSPLLQSADPNVTEVHNLNNDLAGHLRPVTGGAVGALEPIAWNPKWYSRDESCPEYMDGAVWLESEDPLLPIILNSGELSESDTLFLSKGRYDILAMDDAGCTDSMTIEIDGSAEWIINDTVVHPLQDQSNGYIHISEIQGDNPPYLVQWSTGEETCCINDLTAGIYTVSITDNIGCEKIISYELSFTISTSESNFESCAIYPNPATESFYLDCIENKNKAIEIISIDGRVYFLNGNNVGKGMLVNLNGIPAGMYFVRTRENETNEVRLYKLIVLK